MKQEDELYFVDSMEKEVYDHKERVHLTVVHQNNIPKNVKPIKAIRYFKQKRKPDADFLKHKARLCAHIGMQQWGVIYRETYSPVINMISVRIILEIAKIHHLDSNAVDVVLAFPQAYLE